MDAGPAMGIIEIRPVAKDIYCRTRRPGNNIIMRLALFQPDIPQNTGAMLRLAACLGVAVDIIELCGFPLDDRRMRRVGMDYMDQVTISRHDSWPNYCKAAAPSQLVLLTTRGDMPYTEFGFNSGDRLIVGCESAGVPDEVHQAAQARLFVPMAPGMRSLNVAQCAAMVLAEALRQTGDFPEQGAAIAGPS